MIKQILFVLLILILVNGCINKVDFNIEQMNNRCYELTSEGFWVDEITHGSISDILEEHGADVDWVRYDSIGFCTDKDINQFKEEIYDKVIEIGKKHS